MRHLVFAAILGVAVVGGVAIGAVVDMPGLPRPSVEPAPFWRSESRSFDTGTKVRRARAWEDFTIDARQGDDDASSPLRGGGYAAGDALPESTCRMPGAAKAQVILFGVYEGEAISTTALESPDHETTVVDVVIEPGAEPLYVILSSFTRNIWRFSGATDRVQRVVLVADDGQNREEPAGVAHATSAARSAEQAAREAQRAARMAARASRPAYPRRSRVRAVAQGVIGLPADRVTTTDGGACFPAFYEPGSIQAARTTAVVRRALGRQPDVTAGHYSLAAIRLPSARGAKGTGDVSAPRGFHDGLWAEGVRFNPAGLAEIDSEDVVSAVDVRPYDVLPNQFGLSQLAGAGALQPVSDGLKIVRPIPRFPAELNGAHSTAFLLARGVPLPKGSPGHSCVIDEDTGRPIGQSLLCR